MQWCDVEGIVKHSWELTNDWCTSIEEAEGGYGASGFQGKNMDGLYTKQELIRTTIFLQREILQSGQKEEIIWWWLVYIKLWQNAATGLVNMRQKREFLDSVENEVRHRLKTLQHLESCQDCTWPWISLNENCKKTRQVESTNSIKLL